MTANQIKLWVLLPAYNEEDAVGVLLPKISEFLRARNNAFQIVLLDDGSQDRTKAIAESYCATLPVTVLSHPRNRGLGETIRDLFEYASSRADAHDILVRLDCDDTHDPIFIQDMVEKIKEGFDVVTASRFAGGGEQKGVNWYRGMLSFSATLYMRIFFSVPGIREYTCGYRAYRASVVKTAFEVFGRHFIQLTGLGFSCTLEKLLKFNLLKCRFAEVPFVLHYDRKKSKSKMVGFETITGYFVMTFFYYWPWGGWRNKFSKAIAAHAKKPQEGSI